MVSEQRLDKMGSATKEKEVEGKDLDTMVSEQKLDTTESATKEKEVEGKKLETMVSEPRLDKLVSATTEMEEKKLDTMVSEQKLDKMGSARKEVEVKKLEPMVSEPRLKTMVWRRDTVLAGAGKQRGVEVWRVCGPGLARWKRNRRGEFFERECYLVLNSYTPRKSDKLLHDVHFWVGKDSTRDAQEVATRMTVELDDMLDGQAILHREVQGYESALFRSYFAKSGMKFLKGDANSGFLHVKAKDRAAYKKLFVVKKEFQVKRSRTPLTFEIPPIATNLNNRDVFVLDRGDRVYIWCGRDSMPSERFAGCLMVNSIVSSRHGKARKCEVDDIFWQTLDGAASDVRSTDDSSYLVDMKKSESLDSESLELFRIGDESGGAEFTLEKKGKLSMEDLDEKSVFLVNANVGVWIWQGSDATEQDRASFDIANTFVEDRGLGNVPISLVRENQAYRSPLFRALFAGESA